MFKYPQISLLFQKNVLKSNLHLIEVKTVQGMFNFDFDKVRDEDGRFYD